MDGDIAEEPHITFWLVVGTALRTWCGPELRVPVQARLGDKHSHGADTPLGQ